MLFTIPSVLLTWVLFGVIAEWGYGQGWSYYKSGSAVFVLIILSVLGITARM